MTKLFLRIVSFGLLAAWAVSSASAADWPQFQNSDRSGVSGETALAKSWPADGPKVLWTIKLGVGFGPAAVVAGKVYVLDRVDNKQDVLRCVDLASGKPEWTFAYDAPGEVGNNGSRSTPAVDKDYVFTVGCFGDFQCVSTKTHERVWAKNLLKDFGVSRPEWGVTQSPLLHKDTVIVAPQSEKVGVAAFDKKTGDIKWKSPSVGKMAYCSPLLATIDGVEQVIMETYDGVCGVDAGSGKILWKYGDYKVDTAPVPSPTYMSDGRIFLTGGYGAGSAIIQVTRTDGQFAAKGLWASKEVGSHVQTAVFYKDHVYINSDNTGKGLLCLDRDGNITWKNTRKSHGWGGSLLIANDVIYFLDSAEGSVRLFTADPKEYKELSTPPVPTGKGRAKATQGKEKLLQGKDMWAPMALSDGKLIVRDQTQMKCLDVGEGQGQQPVRAEK